uniref:HMG box domain-containing protein n=1 Tax=Globodera rostochiensis TaxID=31243 RepID=A0A914HQX5_GLORO
MVALCQKFGRLLIGAETRFFARIDITNFSTSLNQSPAPKRRILAWLPSDYKGPTAYSLFIKDQMTRKSGGPKLLKIVSTNWKSLSEDEQQNYSERAEKICAELRDTFKKLTNDQKKVLWDKHVKKLQRYRMKKKLHKFYEETSRPKHPLASYMLFVKERFEKQTEPFETRDNVMKFVVETGQQWRQMTDAEKRPYVDQAQGNIAKFHVEMAEWKQKYANEIRAWKETLIIAGLYSIITGKRSMNGGKRIRMRRLRARGLA